MSDTPANLIAADMVPPELSRPVKLSQLDSAPSQIDASEAECAALAKRFALIRIDALSATIDYRRDDDGFYAEGMLRADIVQSCVITLEDFATHIDQPFALRFIDEAAIIDAADAPEVLDDAEHDIMTYANGAFDIGEAVAQTLALLLDPYPRGPDADAALKQKGILREGEERESPFAALSALKT